MLEQLADPGLAGELDDRLELEALAGDSRRLGGGLPVGAEVARSAAGPRRAPSPAPRPRCPRRARARPRPAAAGPRLESAAASSSTKNGSPCERSWTVRTSGARGRRRRARARAARRCRPRRAASSEISSSAAPAAQLVSHPPQRVLARQLVGAVGADDQQRRLGSGRPELGEQLERRRVGPLQVVEDEQRAAVAPRSTTSAQRTASRSVVAVDAVGRRAELGQQQRAGVRRAARSRRGRPGRRAGTSAARRPRGRRPGVVSWLAAPRRTGAVGRAGASSSISRVLPTPASPETSTSAPSPASACAQLLPQAVALAIAPDQGRESSMRASLSRRRSAERRRDAPRRRRRSRQSAIRRRPGPRGRSPCRRPW